MCIEDDPTIVNWPGEEGHVTYGEGVFVGYRYYDTFNKEVAYPFGYGLSYSAFSYSRISVSKTGPNTAVVTAMVTNTSNRDGAEVVQVYVAPHMSAVARPKHELKGFQKIFLPAGESAAVIIELDERAFAYWSERLNDWHIEAGDYTIEVGRSSRDIEYAQKVTLDGDGKTMPLNESSTLNEWLDDEVGSKVLYKVLEELVQNEIMDESSTDELRELYGETPLNEMGMIFMRGYDVFMSRVTKEYAQTLLELQIWGDIK